MAGTPPIDGDLNAVIVSAVNARVEAEMMKALSGDETIGKFVVAALRQNVELKDPHTYRTTTEPFLRNVMTPPANYLNLRWIGPRVWNPDRTPPPERGPALCGDCGEHFDGGDGETPCPCHQAHIASEVDAAPLLAWLLDNASAWDGPVAA